jgi:DMSO/TMAO reductase YedYZ molybdopterin-dependent catalytic subunit
MFENLGFNRRKNEEEQRRREGRLPPGQALTTWDFRVWGEVEQPVQWAWDQFNQLPRSKIVMDIHCVTRWSKFDTAWEGVSVNALVKAGLIVPLPQARYVMQHAEYGFTANLPLEVVLADNFLLATHYDGQPIDPDHGYPLRGVVGNLVEQTDLTVPYFWKGAKWLRGLEFLSQDRPGFWERAGYHNNADVWKEERFG